MADPSNLNRPDRRSEIAEAARAVLIREGAAGFTLRAVAAQVGIKLASLQYHAPSKADLLRLMVTDAVDRYRSVLEGFVRDGKQEPSAAFRAAVDWLLSPGEGWDDITRFEVQFWALAEIDPAASAALDDYMDLYCGFLETLLERLRPDLSTAARALRAASIAGLIEGSVLLNGPGRKARPGLDGLREELVEAALAIAIRS